MKKIIEYLKSSVDNMETEDLDEVCWNYQKGILISGNDAKKIINMDEEFDIIVEAITQLYKTESNVPILKKLFEKINKGIDIK